MRNIKVVIGANYGDEGKGLVTNALATKDSVVVLTNGGSQRGHTVVYNGTRHVFHHFGSGTLKGAATYFSEFFIVNPIEFNRELKELGFKNKVFASDKCRVTTPFDMVANRIRCLENKNPHSTGYGIYETIERYKSGTYFLLYDFIKSNNRDIWATEIEKIREYYSEKFSYIKDAKDKELAKCFEFLNNKNVTDNFIEDLSKFIDSLDGITSFKKVFEAYEDIIMENGQGLAISEDADEDGTPTLTGLDIPSILIKGICNEPLADNYHVDAYYVSRSYLTRHGSGKFIKEQGELDDKTNIPNEYQGKIRFGYFDQSSLNDVFFRITKDRFRDCNRCLGACPHLVITHANEIKKLLISHASLQIENPDGTLAFTDMFYPIDILLSNNESDILERGYYAIEGDNIIKFKNYTEK